MPVWMIAIEWSARLILLGLISLSVWSVAIILERRKFFKGLNVETFTNVLQEKAKKYKTAQVSQAISNDIFAMRKSIDQGLNVLGTLGSTAPFIGLLGTVLGVIVAFGELSQGSADTNAVMFALAEALILTAVGLLVAIPAVIFFNYYIKKSRSFFDEVASKMDLYLANRGDE